MTLEEKQMKVDDLLAVIKSAQKMRDDLLAEIKNEKEIENIKHDVFAIVYHANTLIEKYGLDVPNMCVEYDAKEIKVVIHGMRYKYNGNEEGKNLFKKHTIEYIQKLVCEQIVKSI